MDPLDQTTKQKMIVFATSEHYQGAVELMKQCRTQLTTIVGDTEFATLVNAMTLDIEAHLIQRFVVEVDNIRTGKNLDAQ